MKKKYLFLLLLLIGLGAGAYLSLNIPFDRDEGIIHRGLGCVMNPLDVQVNETCTESYSLVLFGQRLPLRTFHYVGASQQLLYAPLYAAWKSPYSARALGLLLLLSVSLFVAQLMAWPWSFSLALFFSNFFWLSQFATNIDTVAFQFFFLCLALFLVLRKKGAISLGCAGILLFFSLEAKSFFFLGFPSVALIFVKKNNGKRLGLAFLGSALLYALYLQIPTPDGAPYWQSLLDSVGQRTPMDMLGVLPYSLKEKVLNIFLYPQVFFERLFVVKHIASWPALIFFICIIFLVLFHLLHHKTLFGTRELAAFCLSITGFCFIARAQAGHHYILPYFFLLLFIGRNLWPLWEKKKSLAALISGLIVLSQFFLAKEILALPQISSAHESKKAIMEKFFQGQAEENKFYVATNPGFGFLLPLYAAKPYSFLFDTRDGDEHLNRHYQTAKKTGKDLVLLCDTSTISLCAFLEERKTAEWQELWNEARRNEPWRAFWVKKL